jgi:hypothetical protein
LTEEGSPTPDFLRLPAIRQRSNRIGLSGGIGLPINPALRQSPLIGNQR